MKNKMKELNDKIDMLLLLDFRQTYWNLWTKFCIERGYKNTLTK